MTLSSMVSRAACREFGTRHLVSSVSKSLASAVVGALPGAGALEVDALVTNYVPALSNCG
jgi:CubicO group peptidase (beta-lactamase class C family)